MNFNISLFSDQKKQSFWFYSGLIFLSVLYIPFFIFGENSYPGSPADYLDSNTVWLKILSESGLSFAPNNAPLPNIQDQLRVSYGNEIDFIYLLFKIFTPFYALILNSLLISFTAYISLYQLAKYITPKVSSVFTTIVCLNFAVLNHWQFGGVSIAGSPLIILICLKLVHNEKISFRYYIFTFFYIVYSSFIIYGMFLIFMISVTALTYFISRKTFSYKLLIYLSAIIAAYLLTNYRFVLEIMHPSFVSTRPIGMAPGIDYNLAPQILWERFFKGHDSHAVSRHRFILILFVVYAFAGIFTKLKNLKKCLWLFSLIIFFVIISYFNFNLFPGVVKKLHLDFIYGLTLYRFFFYNGVLWFIIFLLILEDAGRLKYSEIFISLMTVFCVVNFYTVLRINIPYQNIRHSFRAYYYSFKDYYMTNEFREIQKFLPLDKSSYRVISYGFDPAAAQYNGFYTADGYFNFYAKSQKEKFSKLISPILESNPELKQKHDVWMNQNFVFTDHFKIGEQILQKYSKKPRLFPVDYKALKELKIKYVFSSIPLQDYYLKEIREVRSKYWSKIYIYQVLY